jgi:hypothetical protein
MSKITPLYPQFVLMDNRTALRLTYDGGQYCYYRDGGRWKVHMNKHDDGSLFTISDIKSLNKFRLTSTTYEKWKSCNGQYAPDNFERYGWEHETTRQPKKEETKNNYKYLLTRR